MKDLLSRVRWWCCAGAALFISGWVMDYSAALYAREHFIGDCMDGVDMEAWHPAIYIGLLLAVASTAGFVARNAPERRISRIEAGRN